MNVTVSNKIYKNSGKDLARRLWFADSCSQQLHYSVFFFLLYSPKFSVQQIFITLFLSTRHWALSWKGCGRQRPCLEGPQMPKTVHKHIDSTKLTTPCQKRGTDWLELFLTDTWCWRGRWQWHKLSSENHRQRWQGESCRQRSQHRQEFSIHLSLIFSTLYHYSFTSSLFSLQETHALWSKLFVLYLACFLPCFPSPSFLLF